MHPNNPYKGYYVVLEGIIGAGKSTQTGLLLASLSRKFPGIRVVPTFEPGGTPRANELRQKLKHQDMDAIDEARLFAEARTSTLSEVIRPALSEGFLVVSDRSFLTSLAYQGFGRELGLENVWSINKEIVGDTLPDCIIYLDIGLEPSQARSLKDNPDKFDKEKVAFWQRVIPGYEIAINKVLEMSPETRVIHIQNPDGSQKPEEAQKIIMKELTPMLSEWQLHKEGRISRERQV